MVETCKNCWFHAHGYSGAWCRQADKERGHCKDWMPKEGATLRQSYGYLTLFAFQTAIGKEAYTLAHSAKEAHDALKGYGVRVKGKEKYRVDNTNPQAIWETCLRDGWCYG